MRILSDQDIIAVKINAILRRGVKKDFWDLAELLKHYSVRECIGFYNAKYRNRFLAISIPKAIAYFDFHDRKYSTLFTRSNATVG